MPGGTRLFEASSSSSHSHASIASSILRAEADAALVRMSSNGKSSTNDDFRGMSHKNRSTLTTKDWVQGGQIELKQLDNFYHFKKVYNFLG